MSDLQELLARVEGAAHGSLNLDVAIMDLVWPDWRAEEDHSLHFVTSSVDAALALAERVLRGWSWMVISRGYRDGVYQGGPGCWMASPLSSGGWDVEVFGKTPALALVAAIIKAKLGEQS